MNRSTPATIRYAIYTRQSVERLEDFSSCQAQFMTCEDFAKATGEPNLCWCNRRFDDEGQSGDTLDRPAMRELCELIRNDGIDRSYAVALDRLSRRMRDTVILLDELDNAGVELRLVHQVDLSEWGSYWLDMFRHFHNDRPVNWVLAQARVRDARGYGHAMEDHAVAYFQLDGGGKAMLDSGQGMNGP